jgi:hypothetical protein
VSFEAVKARVLARLEDRLDPAASKRMPTSLLRQSLRGSAEQLADQEARGLCRPDRDRLVEEVLAELLGCGPLEELFRDPGVREVLVAGPHAVIARRAVGNWLPTSVKFRDAGHLLAVLDRLAARADPVGGATTSVNLFDLQLANGFRAVGVIPPPALGQPATAAFIRTESPAAPVPPGPVPAAPPSGRCPPAPGSITASPRPGSHLVGPPEVPPSGDRGPLARYRNRIVERLIAKFAALGVYDLQRVEVTELRKVVAAYIAEYCSAENIYLGDDDRGRLLLEIMTAMRR